MFEKTKKLFNDVLKYSEKLVKSKKHDPKLVDKNVVPKKIGVYLWRSKINDEILYVGRAFGEKGLYQRIIKQHLAINYTKSVFRKRLAEEQNLNLREESADFIKNNFVFSFISFEEKDKKLASLMEILLILEYSPKYNKEWKY